MLNRPTFGGHIKGSFVVTLARKILIYAYQGIKKEIKHSLYLFGLSEIDH